MAEKSHIWNASILSIRRGNTAKRAHAQASLDKLKNQGNLYADEHRALIALYDDILSVIDKHDSERK